MPQERTAQSDYLLRLGRRVLARYTRLASARAREASSRAEITSPSSAFTLDWVISTSRLAAGKVGQRPDAMPAEQAVT